MMSVAVILWNDFFPQKVIVLPYFYLKKKKVISIVASQKRENKRCVTCPGNRAVAPQELSFFHVLAVSLSSH